ncbi:MAG: hypothetical protein HYZ42_02670 [Bacteroidetes bacterium]|nr:hypothetical protein [Bacteroidota bacterium]
MNFTTTVKDSKLIILILIALVCLCASCSSKNGCTDNTANNFESKAKYDDTSCIYPLFNITPNLITQLKAKFNENSGLVFSNERIWTFTDGGGETRIYSIDTTDGGEKENTFLNNSFDIDWEDIAQDQNNFYIGDFGNNSGNRTDLLIYKFPKIADTSIKNNNKSTPVEIKFHYPDQTDFRKDANTNYDCEAMLVKNNYIYLFTKCHKDLRTRLYKIPATEGNYTAELIGMFNSKGVITGADISPSNKTIALTGYHPSDNTAFIWVIRNFSEDAFFKGNKYKINLGLRTEVGQIEGVAFKSEDSLFLSNENYQNVSPSLYQINIAQVK